MENILLKYMESTEKTVTIGLDFIQKIFKNVNYKIILVIIRIMNKTNFLLTLKFKLI